MFEIREKVNLAPLTTLQVGGPAKYFVEVEDEIGLDDVFSFSLSKHCPIFVIGGGSNVLVSDRGFAGLVVKIKSLPIEVDGTKIRCSGGNMLSEIVQIAASKGLTGLEWAVGIPGTIGGAVRGNAGAYGSDIKNSVKKVEVVTLEKEHLASRQFTNQECEFGYRESIFKRNKNQIIFSVTLELKTGNKDDISKEMKEIAMKRSGKLPKAPSAGSFFMNPEVSDQKLIERFEKDTGNKIRNGVLPAGWLVERCGLRGRQVGGAKVSEQHGNFLINAGGAKAEDFLILASIIKQRVRDELGVQLQEEVQLVGF